MKATKDNPIYTVSIVTASGKLDVTGAVLSLDISERKREISKRVTIKLMNVQAGGKWLTSLIRVRDRVFLYADDGEKKEEVFRGYVWTRSYDGGLTDRELSLRCYDNLVYFQESEDSVYVSAGKTTKDVFSSLGGKWGVKVNYSYESITHSKLVLKGALSDIFTDDLLDLVQDRTGKKYVILGDKDTMIVRGQGTNSMVYAVKCKENATKTHTEQTMEGMVTQVAILGKAEKDERVPVEAVVPGNTGKYGTLQKVISRKENTSMADAKKEAQGILKKDGAPKWTFEATATDIPWIRKGDKVLINAGDMVNQSLIVTDIDREIAKEKAMTLTMELP